MRPRVWLREAWDLVGEDLPIITLAAFLTIGLSLISAFILAMPLSVGLCIMLLERAQGRRPELSQLWEGLTQHFPAAITVWIVVLVAAIPFDVLDYYLHSFGAPWPGIGVAIAILGRCLIFTPLLFAAPLIADRDLSAKDAITISWQRVRPQFVSVFGTVIVYAGVLIFGLFACGFGLAITLPLVAGATVLAYRDVVGNFAAPSLTSLGYADAEKVEEENDETESIDRGDAGVDGDGGAGR